MLRLLLWDIETKKPTQISKVIVQERIYFVLNLLKDPKALLPGTVRKLQSFANNNIYFVFLRRKRIEIFKEIILK